MASRKILDLALPVRSACMELCTRAEAVGMYILVYCTLRSEEEQGVLYASGRTAPGRILTNAKPGQSLHNPDALGRSWAFDAVPMLAGKPQWENIEILDSMGAIGESCGLVWAGRWRGNLRERVHFQISRG